MCGSTRFWIKSTSAGFWRTAFDFLFSFIPSHLILYSFSCPQSFTVVVGELLLSAFFQVIFDRLAPHGELLNFVRQLGGGVESELKKWENTLTMIKAVLSDAEEKQLTDQAVKIWLDSLRNLAYDVEDILDVFATRALEHKLIAEHDHEASTSKVQRLLPVACFRCFNRYTVRSITVCAPA